MTEYSQNGYSVNPGLIAKFTVQGTAVKLNLRKGDCSVLLLHFAAWWHKNISPLKQAQCGGYNNRVIAGSKRKSNHASGTAEDLNWQEFPQGPRRTTAAQRDKIHKQLAYYEGALRWGGDYSAGNLDEMHVEINAGSAKVTAVADKIRKDAMPKALPKRVAVVSAAIPQLKQGDSDADFEGYNTIVRMQRIVGAADDGEWGPKTTAKIASFTKLPAASCKAMTEQVYRRVFGVDPK